MMTALERAESIKITLSLTELKENYYQNLEKYFRKASEKTVSEDEVDGLIGGADEQDSEMPTDRKKKKSSKKSSFDSDEYDFDDPFIDDDELVEITPKSIRLRKRYLKEHERKKAGREAL